MRRRKVLLGGALGVGLLLLLLVVSIKPLVRSRAVSEAARRGFELQAGGVSLGWFRATLRDVEVRPAGVPAVTVRLDRVAVSLGAGMSLRSMTVEDGSVVIEGSVEDLTEQARAWRDRWRPAKSDTSREEGGGGVHYRATGMGLVWRGAFVEGDEQRWTGLQFERSPEVQQLGLDHAELQHPLGKVELAGLRALWQRGAGPDRLVEASIAEARVKASLGSVAPDAADADVDASDDADAARRAARARAQVAPAADEDGGLLSRLPAIDERRGARWRRLLSHLIEAFGERLPEQSKVGSLWLELERGEQHLHLGPSTFDVRRSEQALELELTPQGETKGTPLAVQARLPRSEEPLRFKVEGGPVSLDTLGVREGDFGLVGVAQAEIGGLLEAELAHDGSTLSLRTDAGLAHITVQNERLAPRPVSVQRARLRGRVQVDASGRRYALEEGELQVGEASFQLRSVLERGAEHVAVQLRGGTPLIACQTLLDSAPRGLLDRVEQVKMQGTLSLDVGVEFDSRDPRDMKVRWDLKNGCRITDVPPSIAPERFAAPWQREVVGADNVPFFIETGPGTMTWTPIELMSPHLEAAVLVSEDGRFFRHDGFDARAIEASIQANVRAGRFVRGASTVSMQLAKNLYLSREKQLSRKLQEAVLTMLLEQKLSKHQLLELYFNIVELGPGVYGVKQAAQYYFGTTPDQLTLAQAFFLVSILPSPTRQFFDSEGRLNPGRAAYVRQLLKIAHDRKRITDSELEVGLAEELRFGVSEPREEPSSGPEGVINPDVFMESPPPKAERALQIVPKPASRASATDGTLPAGLTDELDDHP